MAILLAMRLWNEEELLQARWIVSVGSARIRWMSAHGVFVSFVYGCAASASEYDWRLFDSTQVIHGSVRLHDAPRGQGGAAQARDPQGHFALVLSRRQNRRARPQRCR